MRTQPAIPADPLEWRPQTARPGGRPGRISNPLIEPLWEGLHVLAHVTRGAGTATCVLISMDGEDVSDVDPEVTSALAAALQAMDAVIDGYVTDQATRPGTGVSLAAMPRAKGNLVMGMRVETDVAPRDTSIERPLAFVAVDLLRVDGEELFDVPLLERKRILDSLLAQHERVRVTPYTQPPLHTWLDTWRAAGFRGAMLKAANSRYRPGNETDDWTRALATGPRR